MDKTWQGMPKVNGKEKLCWVLNTQGSKEEEQTKEMFVFRFLAVFDTVLFLIILFKGHLFSIMLYQAFMHNTA